MNADRLLAHYEKIADAPDAIVRLRRFVLDLAVRGKLVPQDPSDEPALELLKRIAEEKARLVQAGEIRRDKPLPPVDENATFDVPPIWLWTRLGTVTSYIQRGKSPKYAASNGSLVVSQKCVQWRGLDLSVAKQITVESLVDYEDIRLLRDGDLLWNSTGTGTIGRVLRLVDPPKKLVCDSHVTVVRCLEVDPEYIRTWLRSDHVYALIEDRAAGSTNQVELTAQMAINQFVPLPPLAEQRRIVAKVDELMGLCDRLESARAGREAVRDRLAAASFARLNAADPETLQADARFALDALPAFTASPDQIKALRQTILNLAVRGKLVPQDPNDEPASELLERILVDKADRAVSARDRRVTRVRPLAGEDVPFTVPSNWVWALFGDITISRDGDRIPVSREERERRAKVYDYYRASGIIDKIDGFVFDKPLLLIGEDGANLINRSTPIAFIARGKYWVNNHAHVLDGLSEGFLRYVELFINAIDLKPYVTGTAQPKMNQAKMNSIPVALPPLAEQHRIVAKVDALMALCDRLEASLTAAAATRRRLLNALLAEALAPTDASRSNRSDRKNAAMSSGGKDEIIFAERSAYILTLAYERHRIARRERTFGHVKAQKILHLVEAEVGFDLGRAPIRDAAGPNDFKHMLAVDRWAREHKRFEFENNGGGYVLRQLSDFDKSLKSEHGPDPTSRAIVVKLIDLFVPMNTREAEIFATVYSAWNNLLIQDKTPTDAEIVRGARDDWHADKLRFPASEFFAALAKLRLERIVPKGTGKFVHGPLQQDLFS